MTNENIDPFNLDILFDEKVPGCLDCDVVGIIKELKEKIIPITKNYFKKLLRKR